MTAKRTALRPNSDHNGMSLSELLSFAISNGLGLKEPNKNGDWRWLYDQFEDKCGYTKRNISDWLAGTKPHNATFMTLCDVFTRDEVHREEWKSLFDRKFKEASRQRKLEAIVPNRAQKGDQDSTFARLVVKVKKIRPTRSVLIGPIYLDVVLKPIFGRVLHSDVEYSNLEAPSVQLGGSALFVGRSIKSRYGINSSVITSSTSNENFWGKAQAELLGSESWISQHLAVGSELMPPLTFILRQAEDFSRTMYTYTPARFSFSWKAVEEKMKEVGIGNVIHLSGLMKTALHEDLSLYLTELYEHNIIVVDHGRFTPGRKEHQHQYPIRSAIAQGLVDIHITNLRDYCDLYDIKGANGASGDIGQLVELVMSNAEVHATHSDCITVLRDYDYQQRTPILIVISDGKATRAAIKLSKPGAAHDGFAYIANIANASIITGLVALADEDNTPQGVERWVTQVLTSGGLFG